MLSAVHKMLPFFGRLNMFNYLWCYPRIINTKKGSLGSPLREVIFYYIHIHIYMYAIYYVYFSINDFSVEFQGTNFAGHQIQWL